MAQEAMLRLWRQAGNWRSGEVRISTWLYRVTHNLCIDRIRKRRPSAPIEDAPEPPDPSPSALERLRQALVLRHFDGLSNPEIGERLSCSVEAVESLLARARRQLTEEMRDERGAWQ